MHSSSTCGKLHRRVNHSQIQKELNLFINRDTRRLRCVICFSENEQCYWETYSFLRCFIFIFQWQKFTTWCAKSYSSIPKNQFLVMRLKLWALLCLVSTLQTPTDFFITFLGQNEPRWFNWLNCCTKQFQFISKGIIVHSRNVWNWFLKILNLLVF